MKILLVHPNRTSPRPELHLGLATIAACLRQEGHDVRLLDTRVAASRQAADMLADRSHRLVGLTATTQTFDECVEIAEQVKRQCPSTFVVVGGPHVSMVEQRILRQASFDFGVFGEGERTACELASVLAAGHPAPAVLASIRGLIFRDGTEVVQNERRPYIENLDELPRAALDLFDHGRYLHHRIITSRGCPNRCNFCVVNRIWSRKLRARSVGDVVAEIAAIIDRHGYKVFAFSDDLLNFDPRRLLELCRALIEAHLDIVWTVAGIRLGRMTDELAAAMVRAGCSAVNVGIQSINDGVLQRTERAETSDDIRRGLAVLERARIPIWAQFMIGNIGDTLETVTESIEFAQAAHLRRARFYAAIPFLGTKLYDYVEQHGRFLPGPDDTCVSFYRAQNHIAFVTPEFGYEDRRTAMERARRAGFFSWGTDPRASALEELVQLRLLNGICFRLLSNRHNRQLVGALARARESARRMRGRR